MHLQKKRYAKFILLQCLRLCAGSGAVAGGRAMRLAVAVLAQQRLPKSFSCVKNEENCFNFRCEKFPAPALHLADA